MEIYGAMVDVVLRNWYGIALFALPLVILIVLSKKKVLLFERNSLKEIAIKMTSVVVVHLVALLCVNFIKPNDILNRDETSSLDAPIDEEDFESENLQDIIADPESGKAIEAFEQQNGYNILHEAVNILPLSLKQVIYCLSSKSSRNC